MQVRPTQPATRGMPAGTLRTALVMPLAEQRGGAEAMLLHLLRYSQGGAVRYHLAFLEDGSMVQQVRAMGYPAEVFPAGRLRQPGAYWRTVSALARWYRRERIGVVLSWMHKAHLYAGPAAAVTGLSHRTLWFYHSILPERGLTLVDRLSLCIPAREVWCPSRHAQTAQSQGWPRRATRVVYPCVDVGQFDPRALPTMGEARRLVGLPADGLVVGMVARLERWKGCGTFADACARIAQAHPTARFVIVGGPHSADPEYPGELRQRIERLGLSDRFLLPGHRSDVPMWVQSMDVVVNASYCEPFGMTIVEAMALGKPVVAAAAGGPLEVVRDRENGCLFKVGDADDLAHIVNELLCDQPQRNRLGAQARADVVRRFSARRLAEECEHALLSLA